MMARRRPIIRDQRTAATLGVTLVAAGLLFCWDAWEGRGGKRPRVLSWLLPN